MKNDEIANLKNSIENTIGNIPETMQAEYEAYMINELSFIQHQFRHALASDLIAPTKIKVLARVTARYNELKDIAFDSLFLNAMAEVAAETNNDPQ